MLFSYHRVLIQMPEVRRCLNCADQWKVRFHKKRRQEKTLLWGKVVDNQKVLLVPINLDLIRNNPEDRDWVEPKGDMIPHPTQDTSKFF